ncbi:hypothetical protein SBDP1_290010 [Syntrophobacter sp. SbD1]|nr:hypothetical protein SBDP1_290010 [Syntrophobacter sp. SbD1]
MAAPVAAKKPLSTEVLLPVIIGQEESFLFLTTEDYFVFYPSKEFAISPLPVKIGVSSS